jgi:hypothetical protein
MKEVSLNMGLEKTPLFFLPKFPMIQHLLSSLPLYILDGNTKTSAENVFPEILASCCHFLGHTFM